MCVGFNEQGLYGMSDISIYRIAVGRPYVIVVNGTGVSINSVPVGSVELGCMVTVVGVDAMTSVYEMT